MVENNDFNIVNNDYAVQYTIGNTTFSYVPTNQELKTAIIEAFANWYSIPTATAGMIIAGMEIYGFVAHKFKKHIKLLLQRQCLQSAENELQREMKDLFNAK